MPLPARTGETKDQFIKRCMADSVMQEEFPNLEQRAAICLSIWEERGDMKIDGDNDSKKVKKAKNAVNNAVTAGTIKRPEKCQKCKAKGSVEAHHHKGYDEENMLDIQWLCMSCHKEADKKLRSKKKKDTVQRFDILELDAMFLPGVDENLEKRFMETSEGFLAGRSIVTNIGVFPYSQMNGDVRWELRPEEEVMHPDSLQSLKAKVLTNDHPKAAVDVDNVSKYQVGFLGSDIFADPYHVSVPITITDKDSIDDVKKGKRAISCGYFADLEFVPGVWGGVPYDAVQRNIRYNHVAIVDRGRAGDAARIRMDSWNSSGFSVAVSKEIQKNQSLKEDTNMKVVKLDGVEYQAEAEVIKSLNKANEKNDSLDQDLKQLKEDKVKLEAERDTLTAKTDQLETELKGLKEKQLDEKTINDAVEKRLALRTAAAELEVELKGDESELDIQKAVITKIFPKMDLKDKDSVYIQAVFDTAVKQNEKDAEDENRKITGNQKIPKPDSEINSDKAREKMISEIKKKSLE